MTDFNQRGKRIFDSLISSEQFSEWKLTKAATPNGAQYVDFNSADSETGIWLADIATAGYGKFHSSPIRGRESLQLLEVTVDDVAATCLGLQYAGMPLAQNGQYVAGSGPMRCAAGTEDVYEDRLLSMTTDERDGAVVGTLEMEGIPTDEVIEAIQRLTTAKDPSVISVGCASVNSPAGMIAVAARIVEVAAHVWHKRKFPLEHLRKGFGSCPVCPDAKGEGMIRTNEAIAMAGVVRLHVAGIPDDQLQSYANQLVASADDALGKRTFRDVYTQDARGDMGRMFHKFPFAFSVARIELYSDDTGLMATAGTRDIESLATAWGVAAE